MSEIIWLIERKINENDNGKTDQINKTYIGQNADRDKYRKHGLSQ